VDLQTEAGPEMAPGSSGNAFTVITRGSETGPVLHNALIPVTVTVATPANEGFQLRVTEAVLPENDPAAAGDMFQAYDVA
jgi:hypothetical protein